MARNPPGGKKPSPNPRTNRTVTSAIPGRAPKRPVRMPTRKQVHDMAQRPGWGEYGTGGDPAQRKRGGTVRRSTQKRTANNGDMSGPSGR